MTKPNPDMESTYSHTVSYTSNMRPQVHPMCEAMSAASRHGLDVMASPAAGESAPTSPEVPQAHGLTPPIVLSEHQLRAIGKAASSLRFSASQNDWYTEASANELRQIANTLTGIEIDAAATPSAAVGASGPVAGATVPPEIGKQYVCRNGDVTEEMGAGLRIQTYPFRARVNGVIRTWMRDGKHDESKSSEYDLIAEYHEPEPSPPAESPDDWVTQDRVPARPGIDQRAYLYGTNALSDWEDSECVKWHDMPMHGQSNNCGGIFQLRCRRKDLPTMPVVNNSVERGKLPPVDASKLPSIPQKVLDDRSEWREQAAAWSELFGWCCRNGFDCADNRYNGLNGLGTLAQWILDLKSAAKPNNQNATPPVVPKTRTVTLREYTTDGEVYWTTNPNVRTTGRTCECEVPE